MKSRPLISYFALMGDSLSDRGIMYDKRLFGIIPMRCLSGLQGRSPEGSFTNGLPWSDHLITALANKFTIKKLKKEKGLHCADIADAVINHDAKIYPVINYSYDLKDASLAKYQDQNFLRSYNEGGLTSYDYSWWPSKNISRFFSRLILPTLSDKRKELLRYDASHEISQKEKEETLIIEWSGANDLITVNEKPSEAEVNRAIKERIKNVNQLIKNGYCHFVLFNLPDLSLTPRYQARTQSKRQDARKWSFYFNRQLQVACDLLRKQNPHCTIDLFDINKEFTDMFNNPRLYHLDKAKRSQSYIHSSDFKMNENGTSPATGYMFWDDVHPTADVHAFLAIEFIKHYWKKFNFIEPKAKKQKATKELSLYSSAKQGFFNHSSQVTTHPSLLPPPASQARSRGRNDG